MSYILYQMSIEHYTGFSILLNSVQKFHFAVRMDATYTIYYIIFSKQSNNLQYQNFNILFTLVIV